MKNNKPFLFLGLGFILFAIICKIAEMPIHFFLVLIFIGVAFKTVFLVQSILSGKIKEEISLYLLLTGVSFVLIALVMKYVFGHTLSYNILFFSGIGLKILALILFAYKKMAQPARSRNK